MLAIFFIVILGLGTAWYLYSRSGTVPPGVRIVLVGDSTVADFPGADAAGWGEPLPQFVAPGAVVINHAKGGRSSKTFIAEGRWKRALASRPHVVIIQFGHNDIPAKGPKRATSPGPVPSVLPPSANAHDWYRYNLTKLVREARSAGATPIVVAPMERMQFDEDGSLLRKNLEYAQAAKAVADEESAVFVDLNRFCVDQFSELGEAGMLKMHTRLADGRPDPSHFNTAGARFYAAEFVRQIVRSRREVAALFTSPASEDAFPPAAVLAAKAA